jgi:hypothetical protein
MAVCLEFLIPYYGDPRFLFEAIASIRALEDTDWLLTIVEDAYPGGEQVEREVADLGDERIRYVRNETNLGVSANAHRCIQLARRDRFLVMGFDDLVMPNYGKVVGALLERYPDAALIQPRVQVIDEQGNPYQPLPDRIKEMQWPSKRSPVELSGEAACRSLLRGNWLYTPAICFQREALQRTRNHDAIDVCHDLAFVIDVLLDGGSLIVGDEPCFSYRRHRSSYSMEFARNGARFEQERRYFTEAASLLRDKGWTSAERTARRRMLSRLNAVTQLPQAIRSRERESVRTLLDHVLRS